MRRLRILECDEVPENMDSTAQGRYCHRCEHAVHALDRLDELGAEALLGRSGRVCVEVRVHRGRAMLAEGALAAFGVLVAGCAGHGADDPFEVETPEESYEVPGACDGPDEAGLCEAEWEGAVFGQPIACDAPPIRKTVAPDRASGVDDAIGGTIGGLVTDQDSNKPLQYALVRVSSDLLEAPIEVQTSETGRYEIDRLPPGQYRVEVSYAADMKTRELRVQDGEHLRADFAVDTTHDMVRGVVVRVQSAPGPDGGS